MGNLAVVGSLDIGLDALQRATESFFGGCVNHFALLRQINISEVESGLGVYIYPDRGIIGRPSIETNLASVRIT